MSANYKTLSNFEVATAEEAQSYFMDQAIIKVDSDADLASLPNEVKTAYVLNTGILMARNVANEWIPQGGAAVVSETEPSSPQVGQLWVKPSELLPAPVRGGLSSVGDTTISSAAATWADLSSPATKSIVLPKPAMVLVNWSCWFKTSSTREVQARIAWTGAATGNSYDHMGGWWGTAVAPAGAAQFNQASNSFTVALPAGTTTFKMQARRAVADGTTTLSLPGICITPVAWADEYVAGVS